MALSAADLVLELRSGQTKDHICYFSAKYAAIKSKVKDRLPPRSLDILWPSGVA
jgi:hypothetical protein